MSSKQTYTREEILEVIALKPCHVTGVHNPRHTLANVCEFQRADAFRRLLWFLKVEENELPRRLHQNCYFCREQEELQRWTRKEH